MVGSAPLVVSSRSAGPAANRQRGGRRLRRWLLLAVACSFGSAQALDDYGPTCSSSGCHGGPPPGANLNIVSKGGEAADSAALQSLIDAKNLEYTSQTPPLSPPMPGLTGRTDVDWDGIVAYLRAVRNGQLDSSSHAFGNQRLNATAPPFDVKLTNRRSEDVTLDVQNVPTGFTLALIPNGTNCLTNAVAADSSCVLRITFQPTALLTYGGTLQVKLNGTQVATPLPLQFSVSGAATAPHLSVAALISLVSKVNDTAAGPLQLSNTGSAPLLVSAIAKGPSGSATSQPATYSVVTAAPAANACAWPPPFTLAPGSSCTVGVVHTPPATPPARPTQASALLTIGSDSDSPAGVHVTTAVTANWTGTPVPVPEASLSLGSNRLIDFSPIGADGLSSGEVLLGDTVTRQFTISNTGVAASRLLIKRIELANTAEGDFAVADDCTGPVSHELVAGSGGLANRCTVTLTFTPKAPAARRDATLTVVPSFPEVEENDPLTPSPAVPVALGVSGYGYLPLALGPPPPLLRHAVGGIYRPSHIVLANTGVQPLLLNDLQLAGTGFRMTDNCPRAPAALPPPPDPGPPTSAATQCAIDVTFDPTAVGPYAATLTVTSNAPGSPQQLAIDGEGTATTPPVLAWQGVSGVIDEGTVTPGQTSEPRVLHLQNNGPGGVTLSLLNAIGERASEFALTPSTAPGACPAYVPGQPTLPLLIYDNEGCDILATFSPTAPGLRQATVQVVSNGTNPASLSLQGSGAAVPATPLEPSTTLLLFSGVQQGSHSVPQLLALRNNTATTARVTRIVVGDGFEITGGSCAVVPFDLAAGAVCTMSVQFAPTDTGTTTAPLSIYSDGQADPLQVRLEGAAVAKPDASSGGCSLSDGRSPFDPVLWLSAIAAVGVLWQRRRQARRDTASAGAATRAAAGAGAAPRARGR